MFVLVGDPAGQHSIRVNDQFRLCFAWTAHGPEKVGTTDGTAARVRAL